MAKTGFCGSLLRCVLTIINVVFFIVGALIFAIAAILNWDKGFVINKIKENTNGIIDLNILSGLTVVLFILGSAIILVSVIGLVGACCASKCFLIFYEIILAVLFVFHLIILIYFLVKEQEILDKINSNLNKEVIKAQNASSAAVEEVCKDLKYISKNFKCCGFNSSADFSPETLSYCCDQNEYDSPGCGKKVIDFIKKDAINILLISSAVFLSLELLFIIAVPFLIYKVSKSGDERYESYAM